MLATKWLIPLALSAVLALAVVAPGSAAEVCAAPEQSALQAGAAPAPIWLTNPNPPYTCNEWVATTYFSDASHTTKVGQCTITCAQVDQGNAYPLPNSGGVCTGVTSAFSVRGTTLCRCIP